jgi:hypothetical protein
MYKPLTLAGTMRGEERCMKECMVLMSRLAHHITANAAYQVILSMQIPEKHALLHPGKFTVQKRKKVYF